MVMTWPVLAAVLCGALLHASWNALVKSSTDKTLDTALIHVLCSLLALPFVLWFGPPPPATWPYIGASLVIHVGYYFALAGAYRHGDLGLTYPLMRGSAPMLVAVASFLLLGETLTPLAWTGIVAVSCGVLLLGASAGLLRHRQAVLYALANAAIIAVYTVIDGRGVRLAGVAAQYIAMLFVLDGWPFALMVFIHRKGQVWPYVRRRWPVATGGALASVGSYAIALWAMTVAPVAMVAALRETSVLFAVLIGVLFLGERWTRWRGVGTAAIVAGVLALRLG